MVRRQGQVAGYGEETRPGGGIWRGDKVRWRDMERRQGQVPGYSEETRLGGGIW